MVLWQMYKRLQKLSGYAKRLTELEDTLLVLGQRADVQADEVLLHRSECGCLQPLYALTHDGTLGWSKC